MLAVDGRERLRLWGRLVTVWHRGQDAAVAQRGGPNTKELAAACCWIGVAAVVIALFVPLMVPGLRDHKLFSGGGGSGRDLVALPNPLVQMNSQLRQKVPVHVLTYQTTDPSPQYLQVYVLSNLTTNTWTLAPAAGVPVKDGQLPAPPGLSRITRTTRQTTKITLAKGLTTGPHQASFLPLPYPARSVSVAGDWRSDPRSLTMFSAQSLGGLSYTAVSREVSPTVQQLQQSGEIPDSISTNYLSVPAAFKPLSKLAQRITSGQNTFYGEAVALQRWFTQSGKFTYSLNVHQPDTAQALINFLTKTREGYCQQFAFAMAVLARLLDIPSRVAVGYTEGTSIGHDRWDVRTSDAHAWPELYFQGAGWLRFEPTPFGADGQATAVQPGLHGAGAARHSGRAAERANPAGHGHRAWRQAGRLRSAGQARAPQRPRDRRGRRRRSFGTDLADRRGGGRRPARHAPPGQVADPAPPLVTRGRRRTASPGGLAGAAGRPDRLQGRLVGE